MKIANVCDVKNFKRNHGVLCKKRALDMYVQLKENDKSLVTPLTLRPIVYIKKEVGRSG